MQQQYSLSLQEACELLANQKLGPKEVKGVLSYYQTHSINTIEYEYLFNHEIVDFMAEHYLSLIQMVDSCKKDVDSWGRWSGL